MSSTVGRFLPLVAVILLLALFPATSYSQASPESGDPANLPNHERQLLEKIDRLERHVAELEARAGIS
ncbi:MAG TPA: hypothetical protein VJW55_19685, partial [Candidatus Angelobacter sp.]|nr:hypothetical protein [Candidatus Angelobacter sp.]